MAAKAIVAAPSVLLRDVAVLDRTGDQHNEGRLPAECLHSRLGLRVESSQEAGPSRTGSHLRRDRSDSKTWPLRVQVAKRGLIVRK